MVIPRFDINQIVIVYDNGKLVEEVVSKIRIDISEEKTVVGYQFKKYTESFFWRSIGHDFFKPEHEVFSSKEDFLKRQEA